MKQKKIEINKTVFISLSCFLGIILIVLLASTIYLSVKYSNIKPMTFDSYEQIQEEKFNRQLANFQNIITDQKSSEDQVRLATESKNSLVEKHEKNIIVKKLIADIGFESVINQNNEMIYIVIRAKSLTRNEYAIVFTVICEQYDVELSDIRIKCLE